MGIAELLACAAVLVLVTVVGLLYFASRSTAPAAPKKFTLVASHEPLPGTDSVHKVAALANCQQMYRQRRWQYKHKVVTRYNPQLRRMETVEALALVYE